MTDEVKRVVAGLRYCYRHISCKNLHTGEKCPDYDSCQKKVSDNVSRNESLADLIESLAAELEQVKQERDGLNILLGQAQSMLETRTRERDAAVEELDHSCGNCKYVDNAYGEEPCPSRAEYVQCDSCPGWQWRGAKEVP